MCERERERENVCMKKREGERHQEGASESEEVRGRNEERGCREVQCCVAERGAGAA